MSHNTQEILETAQALPTAEQVELIEALIAGLDEADPEPLDEAWIRSNAVRPISTPDKNFEVVKMEGLRTG